MKVAVGLRRVAAGKRTSGRRAAQIALNVSAPNQELIQSLFLTLLTIKLGLYHVFNKRYFYIFLSSCPLNLYVPYHSNTVSRILFSWYIRFYAKKKSTGMLQCSLCRHAQIVLSGYSIIAAIKSLDNTPAHP